MDEAGMIKRYLKQTEHTTHIEIPSTQLATICELAIKSLDQKKKLEEIADLVRDWAYTDMNLANEICRIIPVCEDK